jgi:hypothetical protein
MTSYEVAEIYNQLRSSVFTTSASSLGLAPAADEAWGVVMEIGYPKAVATLFVLTEGTISLYFSNGGGVIGVGPHPGPKRAGGEWIELAQHYVMHAMPTTEFPLPEPGFIRFYLLTGGAVRTEEARQDDLENLRHPLSPLFRKGHEVITEIRLIDEERKKG